MSGLAAQLRCPECLSSGTLNDGGYVSIGTARLVIAGVARARGFVACIPNYPPRTWCSW